jgi:outer membrane protein OmpA-like peptidoglycan-associated protein
VFASNEAIAQSDSYNRKFNVVGDQKKSSGKSGETANPVKDSDGDGIPDSEDLCPDIPGNASAKGCPDSDGDGIPDYEDDCPNVSGLAKYKGCPDSDGDGIPDNKDVCPYEKGPASNNGCPLAPHSNDESETYVGDTLVEEIVDETIYDTPNESLLNHYELFIYEQEQKKNQQVPIEVSGGGLYQNEGKAKSRKDKTIRKKASEIDNSIASSATNTNQKEGDAPSRLFLGRPMTIADIDSYHISNLIKHISFERGRIILTPEGTNALNELSDILRVCYDWKVIFHCFVNETDNNYRDIQLSVNRGAAIKTYLVTKKSIAPERIEHKGYGNVHITDKDTTIVKSHIVIEVK